MFTICNTETVPVQRLEKEKEKDTLKDNERVYCEKKPKYRRCIHMSTSTIFYLSTEGSKIAGHSEGFTENKLPC